MTTNTPPSASQELVSELGEVREELGAERARRQMAEERAAALEAELETLRDERESPETIEDASEGVAPRSYAPGAQEAPQRPWWRRVFRR